MFTSLLDSSSEASMIMLLELFLLLTTSATPAPTIAVDCDASSGSLAWARATLWYLSSRWVAMSMSWADFKVEPVMFTAVLSVLLEKRNEPPTWNIPGESSWASPTAFCAPCSAVPDIDELNFLKRLYQLLYEKF